MAKKIKQRIIKFQKNTQVIECCFILDRDLAQKLRQKRLLISTETF